MMTSPSAGFEPILDSLHSNNNLNYYKLKINLNLIVCYLRLFCCLPTYTVVVGTVVVVVVAVVVGATVVVVFHNSL